ncbi:MAG: hypothetical protein ABI905_09210 [Betaproteobacteria bacterium]
MSNLLKALKRAERDRQAALEARQGAPATDTGAVDSVTRDAAPEAGEEAPTSSASSASPAVMRRQRDAARLPSRPVSPPPVPPVSAHVRYRGVLVSCVLAISFAVAVKLWIAAPDTHTAGFSATSVTPTRAQPASPPTQYTMIPAALRVEDAGPMQLRLDRSLDSAEESARRNGTAR